MNVKLYSIILFLNNISGGILIPVLTMLILNKGISLSETAILLGTYGFTVFILELPSGIAADLLGRKKSFCISLFFSLLAFLIIFLGNNLIILFIGFIFYGTSRAFSSGSFDALFLDQYINEFGKDNISKATMILSLMESIGLAIGSLIGGLLPQLSSLLSINLGTYDLNILLKLLITSIVLLISIIFVKETFNIEKSSNTSIRNHISTNISLIKNNNTLIYIFISVFAIGFFLSTIETYWQPQFTSLLPNNNLIWLLGVLAFLYFTAAMLGNLISEKAIATTNNQYKKVYFISRFLLIGSLFFLSLQNNYLGFIFFYSLIYLFFGISNIPEMVLINKNIPNESRASILSVQSLTLQLGTLFASITSSLLINHINIKTLWLISCIVLLSSLFITFKGLSKSDAKSQYNTSNINEHL